MNFRVASNERRFDRATEGWVDGDTLYTPVSCWRKLAENVHASFVVGDPIVVHGRVYSRSYDKEGQRHSVTEMEALAVGPDLTRCTAAVTRTKRADGARARSSAPGIPEQRSAGAPDGDAEPPGRGAPADGAAAATATDGPRGAGQRPAVEAAVRV